MTDLSKLSTEDLVALRSGNIAGVSTEGLQAIRSLRDPKDGTRAEFRGAQGDTFRAMNSMLFNFGDELAAGATALGSKVGLLDKGITYDRALETIRDMDSNFQKDHPGRALASSLGGGVVGAGATMPVAAAAMPARLAQGTSWGARLGQGAVAGAEYGALAGFGEGQGGAENRLNTAATGGLIGGATGTALQGAAEVAKPALRMLGRGLRGVGEAVGWVNPKNAADDALYQAATASGLTPDEYLMRMAQSEAPLTPADVGGEQTRRLARSVVTQPGPGSEQAINALNERAAGRSDRLLNAFSKYVSPEDNALQTVDDIIAARAAEGAPAYRAATENPVTLNSNLERMLQEPLIQEGLASGATTQRIEAAARNIPFEPNDYILNARQRVSRGYGHPPGTETSYVQMPNMRSLQAAKEGLDAMLESYRNPITGVLNLDKRGRAIDELRRSFLGELNSVNPAYGEANRNWADATALKNAVSTGRQFLRGDIDMTAERLAQMTAPEKSMARIGAARELRRLVETTGTGNDAIRKFFGTPERVQRLSMLFDNPNEFAQFTKYLDDERLAQSTERFILGNSQTANKAAELAMLGEEAPSSLSTRSIGQALLQWGANKAVGASRTARAEKLAPVLFGTDREALSKALSGIEPRRMLEQSRNAARGRYGDTARNLLSAYLAGQMTRN